MCESAIVQTRVYLLSPCPARAGQAPGPA